MHEDGLGHCCQNRFKRQKVNFFWVDRPIDRRTGQQKSELRYLNASKVFSESFQISLVCLWVISKMGSDIKKSGRHTNETVTVFYVLNATHEDKTYVMWCQMKALAILRRSIPMF